MKKTKRTLGTDDNRKVFVLHVAFELSQTKWKLGFSNGNKIRFRSIIARNLKQLHEEIEKAKERFKLKGEIRIVSCYEAGRDGFWLHRYLLSCGIENIVVDSSSIEVNRRKRRTKTDRVDAGKLLKMLMRYHGGERTLWSVVNVPSVEAEDGRQLNRELEALNIEHPDILGLAQVSTPEQTRQVVLGEVWPWREANEEDRHCSRGPKAVDRSVALLGIWTDS